MSSNFTSSQMQESNPGWLDGKRERYLSAMPSPIHSLIHVQLCFATHTSKDSKDFYVTDHFQNILMNEQWRPQPVSRSLRCVILVELISQGLLYVGITVSQQRTDIANVVDNHLIRLDGSVFHVAVETFSRHPSDMNKKTRIRSNPQSLNQTVSRINRCYLPLESTWHLATTNEQ